MRTDTEIKNDGIRLLIDNMGSVEAEKFISIILREPFDYTAWQNNLWADKSIEEISKEAMLKKDVSA